MAELRVWLRDFDVLARQIELTCLGLVTYLRAAAKLYSGAGHVIITQPT